MRSISIRAMVRPALAFAMLAMIGSPAAAYDSNGSDLTARLRGYDEVPAVSSAARGRFSASVDGLTSNV